MSAAKIIPNKPFIIFLYGFPGAGKTWFARQLAESMDNVAHLQQDRLSHELYGENTQRTTKASRNAMNYMTREFLKAGVSVVYDAEVPRLAERRTLRDAARKYKATPILLWLQIDADGSYNRIQKRDRRKADDHHAKDYDKESFKAITQRMQNPDNEDYVVISGKHTFQTQRAAVIKKFYELGILTPDQLNDLQVKPGLVNLVPQSVSRRPDGAVARRNINIRQTQ